MNFRNARDAKEPQPAAVQTALEGLTVLDLTQGSEQYCGKMFAQLGAEVLLVEPIAGARNRCEGPFLRNVAHKEHGLQFAYLNQGKRGICLDLDVRAGQEIFLELVAHAALVIEAEPPGRMQERALDHGALSRVRSSIVTASITPFGQDGPYAMYQADDLVALAMGGLLCLGGYPDGAPLAPYGNQAVLAAAQFAAVASMVAIWHAESSEGAGQHIDVSIQESVAMALENSAQFVNLEETIRRRNGGEQRQAGTGVFACRDGMIYLMAGGVASNRFWSATTEWLVDENVPDAASLRDPIWNDERYLQATEAKQIFSRIFNPFAMRYTKAELYAEGQRRRIPICPVSTTADLLENRQLAYRGYFKQTLHPYSGQTLTVPGAPYGLSVTPWTLGRPAPRLGEHTSEVLAALGYKSGDTEALIRAGVVA